MKKRMATLICAGLAAAFLAGCSGKPAETAPATTAAETTVAAAEAETEAVAPAAEAAKPDNFPKKNIKIIVPYDAGGGVDITTRLLTDAAGKDYFDGKSLIVENMPGTNEMKAEELTKALELIHKEKARVTGGWNEEWYIGIINKLKAGVF